MRNKRKRQTDNTKTQLSIDKLIGENESREPGSSSTSMKQREKRNQLYNGLGPLNANATSHQSTSTVGHGIVEEFMVNNDALHKDDTSGSSTIFHLQDNIQPAPVIEKRGTYSSTVLVDSLLASNEPDLSSHLCSTGLPKQQNSQHIKGNRSQLHGHLEYFNVHNGQEHSQVKVVHTSDPANDQELSSNFLASSPSLGMNLAKEHMLEQVSKRKKSTRIGRPYMTKNDKRQQQYLDQLISLIQQRNTGQSENEATSSVRNP